SSEIEHLFVEPAHIGHGVGRCLFDAARLHALASDATHLRALSDPHAKPFYHHMGMRQVGEIVSPMIAGRRLPLMQLDLMTDAEMT
ncbi:MAG: GNAT family N-acetyltransferase, partial [Pseudomonadota bacterium]